MVKREARMASDSLHESAEIYTAKMLSVFIMRERDYWRTSLTDDEFTLWNAEFTRLISDLEVAA
jgi:hypothetical protein